MTEQQLINYIQKKRVELDVILQTMNPRRKSAEITLSYRSLQLARAWYGEILVKNKWVNKYPVAEEVCDIPETSDQSGITPNKEYNELDWINETRAEIENMLGQLESLDQHIVQYDFTSHIQTYQVVKHLTEARMWLGFHLGQMRENAEC